MAKQQVIEQIESINFDQYCLEGDIDAIQNRLIEVKKLGTNLGYCKVSLQCEEYGHDGAFEIKIYGTRLETDEEYERRIKQLKKIKEADEKKKEKKNEKERQQYERLKRKFADI